MKSTQRPSKQQPKVINPNSGETTVIEAAKERSLPNDSTVELTQEEEAIDQKLVTKPIVKSSVKQEPKKQWQRKPSEPYTEEPELPPEPCQRIQFPDCNSEVGCVIFECYHCQQGIISEYTGEPVMGEYKGRPSVILAKVKCPNCEQTAIRLTTGKVLSTTAIPSLWQQ